ncbi:MAG: hypothetical protein LBR56_06995 [Sporomusaceae bacterium]|nr:hypothetical protein [Sporomusaceae bacterium]
MSNQSQQKNMQAIYNLISQDLGYIYGERESGPNGAKKQFLTKSAAFLRALGKDLGFQEMKVTTNPSGIAVSGDVTLIGLWHEGNGLYFQISQPLLRPSAFLYRHITHMKDYSSGQNQWLLCALFEMGEYEKLINILSDLLSKANSAIKEKPSRQVGEKLKNKIA